MRLDFDLEYHSFSVYIDEKESSDKIIDKIYKAIFYR
jgi:hypothetical protein